MKSVDIFKTIISEYIPEYKSSLEETVFVDVQALLTKNELKSKNEQNRFRWLKFSRILKNYWRNLINQKSIAYLKPNSSTTSSVYDPFDDFELTLKQQLRIKEIDLNEVIDEFLGDLAQLYLEEPKSSDPIISFLLTSNYPEFLEQLEFAKELKLAFQRIDRQEKKVQLKQLEEQEEDEVIRTAFHRIERAEKKRLLQEIEGLEILEPNGTEFTAYSVNPAKENTPHSIKPVAAKNQIPWKFIIRIAAVLILVLVPVGISVLFFGDDETSVGGKSPKPKNGKSIIYAETGDLTEIKRINIPLPKVDNSVSKIVNNEQSFGFATKEENVTISVVFTGDQIDYLAEKITLLEKKVKELKTKNIKDKEATIKSLVDISTKCISEKQILESKEFTYQFDKKSFKLTIFSSKKIDPENLKVYSIKKDDSTFNYFLKIKNSYYQLSGKSGQLKMFTNNDVIEELDSDSI
jgi:hypothetical protein